MLCDDDLEGREGFGGGREVQGEGDIRILTADSCCHTVETNTTL